MAVLVNAAVYVLCVWSGCKKGSRENKKALNSLIRLMSRK